MALATQQNGNLFIVVSPVKGHKTGILFELYP